MQKLRIGSTLIEFGIRQWQTDYDEEFPVHWCDSLLVITNEHLNYKNSGEFLCQHEWKEIVEYAEHAVLGELKTGVKLGFIEPDISFQYFCEGDCSMELTVHLSEEQGFNGKTSTISFGKNEVEHFLECLKNEIRVAREREM